MRSQKPDIAVVLDPRFPGGTASAVAQEIPVLKSLANVSVHGQTTMMFKDNTPNPALKTALLQTGSEIIWDSPKITADLILYHNPSALKFDTEMHTKMVSQNLIVVTHENFNNPDGSLSFDVEGCLEKLDAASLNAAKYLAPVSPYNRQTVETWLEEDLLDWRLLSKNWFNICDFEMQAPTNAPQDRRGRHSRPGFEKFPDQKTMELLYPPHALSNVILGGDIFNTSNPPTHWTLFDFRSRTVSDFLSDIDFFVYFTNKNWRESFGRVFAEAISAGKLVITDPETAQNFGDGVVGIAPQEVDARIKAFINDPKSYEDCVREAQETLKSFSPESFETQVKQIMNAMRDKGQKVAL